MKNTNQKNKTLAEQFDELFEAHDEPEAHQFIVKNALNAKELKEKYKWDNEQQIFEESPPEIIFKDGSFGGWLDPDIHKEGSLKDLEFYHGIDYLQQSIFDDNMYRYHHIANLLKNTANEYKNIKLSTLFEQPFKRMLDTCQLPQEELIRKDIVKTIL